MEMYALGWRASNPYIGVPMSIYRSFKGPMNFLAVGPTLRMNQISLGPQYHNLIIFAVVIPFKTQYPY